MKNGQENRRSFRVNEPVYLKYDVLNDSETNEGLDRRKIRLGMNDGAQFMLLDIESRLAEAMYSLNAETDQAGRCIKLLNDKINIALDQLPSLRTEKAALAKLPPRSCDVSADGMVFAANNPIAVDTKLYIRFLLSTDNRYVETFSNVVRITEPPAGNDAQMKYGIAIEFVGMTSAQREILIQHMFNRESETLRMRRLELDTAGG